ncbi:transglycosylase domain-containing protein [Rhodococcus qingshengii]|uniref:transglycosylase domain-containing protein n=1 Tax=Rhodococcus qingshengii TaxID=334542 RepID=UPI0029433975|nr:transglycosylase domain-containing protein [Rhodococcus qingshengii]WOI85977.1 transglycosylase domain-containing protein [Rhodococcus qingshengii]
MTTTIERPARVGTEDRHPDPILHPVHPEGPRGRWRWAVWYLIQVAKRLALGILVLLVAFEIVTASFIWFTPSRTSYMLQNDDDVVYQYVSLDHVSRYIIAATLAHEDQQLGARTGAFSIDDFRDRSASYLTGHPDPSGSTIPQQLVKNIFLWSGHNPVRKGIEAVMATQFSLTLSDKRIVELYLNYAQFGPQLYGVCAATWYYFDAPPWDVTQYQAAQLMGILPLPSLVERAPGGGIDLGPSANPVAVDYINGAANVHVPAELDMMGGWREAVATIGIHDTATDHAPLGDPDGCSSMPDSVAKLIAQ